MTSTNKYSFKALISAVFLIAIGLITAWLGNGTATADEKLSKVVDNLTEQITTFDRQLDNQVVTFNTVESESYFDSTIPDLDYPSFVYEQGRLTYWSYNHFVPQYLDISSAEPLDFLEFRQGQYIVIKKNLSGANRQLIGLIPIFNNSQIDNQHLQSTINTSVFAHKGVAIGKYKNDDVSLPVCIEDKCLFYVSFEENYIIQKDGLRAFSFVILLLGIFLIAFVGANQVLTRYQNIQGAIVYLLFLIAVRWLMLVSGFSELLSDAKLFDSKLFASSVFNISIGDMLLNILFIVAYVLTLILLVNKRKQSPYNVSSKRRGILTVLLVLCSHLGLFVQYLIIRTLYNNSSYSLDITQSINFGYDRVFVFSLFVFGSVLFFLFTHLCFSLLLKFHSAKHKKLWISYGVGTLLFALFLIVAEHSIVILILSSLYFVLVVGFNLVNKFKQFDYFTFIYLFCGILVSSGLCTYAIDVLERARIQDNKERFADHFLIENDILAEFLLAEAIENVKNDAFIKSRMFSPFVSNKNAIKEKVKKIYLNKYFDRYQLHVGLYNSNGMNYDLSDTMNIAAVKNSLNEDHKTTYKDLFYVNNLDAGFTKRYVGFIEVKNYGLVTGHVMIDLRLKKIIPDNVYPELLVDSRFLLPFENKNYSYAIYNNAQLLSRSGEFNYQNDFDGQTLASKKAVKDDYEHLVLQDHEGRHVVISSKVYPLHSIASNFSFLLLILMFLTVIILIGYAVYFYLSARSLNYSARIQLYFNLAFFLPLFAVSVTTVSIVTASYKEEVEHEHFKKASLISRNIEEPLGQYLNSGEQGVLENDLASIAGFSNTDANLFDVSGKLIATSQPLIYKKAVFSTYLAPHAMTAIVHQGQSQLTIGEQVGKLTYNTTYVGIKEDATGDLIAILSVPYFESEHKLEKEKIEVFTTILNIFTLVFIVFLVISYFASKWLTFPLYFITQKLKQTTLSEKNEPLQWDSSDEIGLMVSEYNKMVVNLEDSKKALARTQKESAWREVAQQVAHEIKNPITPMKLTLQHLKRAIGEHPELEEVQKPIGTLLSQVDNLSEIATSFSSFAKMPMPEQERYELTKVVKSTVALYENNENDEVLLEISNKEIHTIGDEQLMSRILSNIIINAKQSVGSRPIQVLVKLEIIENDKILLTIQDNGSGIPEEIREKVFIPNFTTKSTGSGIGLAIAKHGIEHSSGKIWFETITDEGTTFYIELPIVL